MAFAGSEGSTPAPRKFASGGGGKFPKPEQLFGALLIITPVKVEQVRDNFSKDPSATKAQLTADTAVLDGEFAGEYPAMWWGQSSIVAKAETELRRPGGGDPMLGRLFRFPQAKDKATYPDRHVLEQAIAAWRPGQGQPPGYAWALEAFSAEDEAQANRWLDGERPGPSDTAHKDPFAE